MATTNQAELVKSLVDAGVHFGHRVSRWNPKMEPYIHGKRNMIHIIDVRETIKGLLRAKKLLQNMVAGGKEISPKEAARQLREYFKGDRTEFDLPLAPEGTQFQKSVWQNLCGIPYGETISYGELARRFLQRPASRFDPSGFRLC